MAESVYAIHDSTYHPRRWAGSPWSASMQHGGPVIGLFARETERVADDLDMRLARLTVDLFKAVPLAPLVAETRVIRQGRRVAALESILHPRDDGSPVCRASSLLLRATPSSGPVWESPEAPPPPFDASRPATHPGSGATTLPPGFHERVEIRPGLDEAGPFVWMTTSLDLVADEPISPLQRAAMLTDMTLGIQMRMARERARVAPGDPRSTLGSLMINTDTTIYLERPVVGGHLAMRPTLLAQRNGIGTAEVILYDADGRVGRSLQSALTQRHFAATD